MLKKGTIRRLKDMPKHFYVKLEDKDFAWWRLEDFLKDEDKRMMVHMTDEDAMSESHFEVIIKN